MRIDMWNQWNEGGGPRYPHEKVIQFCFRNYPAPIDRQRTTVLDWGCGGGVNTIFLCAEGFRVYGTDVSETGIANARRRLADLEPGSWVDLRVEAVEALSLPPQSIDLVICVGVLDCIGPDAARTGLNRLVSVLRPKAKAFFLFAAEDDFRINGPNVWGLHGYTRSEVSSLFEGFSRVWIDTYLTTYRGGGEIQRDWLVTLER